jgi:hypothetical protein
MLDASLPILGAAQLNDALRTLIWALLRQRPRDVRLVLPKPQPEPAPPVL